MVYGDRGQPLASREPQPSRTGRSTRSSQSIPVPFRDVGAKEVLREGKEIAHAGQHQAPAQGTPRSSAHWISGRCLRNQQRDLFSAASEVGSAGDRQPHFAGGKLSLRDEAACLKHCREDAQSLVLSHTHSPLNKKGDAVLGVKLDVGSLPSTQGLALSTYVTVSLQDESHFLKNIKTARRAAVPSQGECCRG